MTILQMNIYHTLLAIEEEKAKANELPKHTLLVKDNLHERVEQRIGYNVSFGEFYKALQQLFWDGRVHLGDTATDQYVKVVYREVESAL